MNKAAICAAGILVVSLSACSLNPFAKKDNVDYRNASKGPQLDIPPDLTAPRYDERFRPAGPGAAGSAMVLPKLEGVKLERSGNERWLVVNQKPEAVWPIARAFWMESGFTLTTDRAEIGVIETDWQETRTKIASDPVRSLIGFVTEKLFDSGIRDRYRMRLERGVGDTTEIYVSHRRLEEVATGEVKQGVAQGYGWAARPANPEMEAEMLNRLLVRIGLPPAQAQQVVAAASASGKAAIPAAQNASLPARAAIVGSSLSVDDPFDRAWRRVGLALDRVGFTVVDRDRTQGLYYVRYADDRVKREEGLVEKLKFWKADEGTQAEQYRVSVKETAGKSDVAVQDKAGAAAPKVVSDQILTLLRDQLK